MISGPKPALPADATAWLARHDAGTFTNATKLLEYRQIVANSPHLATAMDYSSQIETAQDAIWDAIDAAESAGGVQAISPPAAYPLANPNTVSPLNFTPSEAIEVYAAKVAHAMWLEVNKVFPWTITEFSESELRYLLDPAKLFVSWVPAGTSTMGILCDHSPKYIYDLIVGYIGSPINARHALGSMWPWGERYRHSTVADALGIVTIADAEAADPDWVSRNGCAYGSAMMVAAARAVNLPSEFVSGEYGPGSGHSNAVVYLPGEASRGAVLSHGDDWYNAYMRGMPSLLRMVPYTEWNTDVREEADDTERYYQSVRKQVASQLKWRSPYVESLFAFDPLNPTASGWPYIIQGNSYWNWPIVPLADREAYYQSLVSGYGDIGINPKPDASNTGTIATLTPVTGPVTITSPGLYSYKDVTGGIVVQSEGVTINGCRISAATIGVQIDSSVTDTRLERCEITNCTTGIFGMLSSVKVCNIHDIAQTGIAITGTTANHYPQILLNHISSTFSCISSSATNGNKIEISFNTIVSGSSYPAISVSQDYNEIRLAYNWIDGGSYALSRPSTSTDTVVASNKFGRTAANGLLSNALAMQVGLVWFENTYEDDGSPAASTDTAPL